MAANKILNIQPIALTNTLTTNILNCNVTAVTGPVGFTMTQPYLIIRRIQVTNKTAGAVTFSLWKGATAGNVAGTELYNAVSVAANSTFVDTRILRLDAADFIVGGASAATSLTIEFEGEIGVSG
jgi:hypothetical protein